MEEKDLMKIAVRANLEPNYKKYLIPPLEIAKSHIQIMIDKGMDNDERNLSGLMQKANDTINQIKSGEKI